MALAPLADGVQDIYELAHHVTPSWSITNYRCMRLEILLYARRRIHVRIEVSRVEQPSRLRCLERRRLAVGDEATGQLELRLPELPLDRVQEGLTQSVAMDEVDSGGGHIVAEADEGRQPLAFDDELGGQLRTAAGG